MTDKKQIFQLPPEPVVKIKTDESPSSFFPIGRVFCVGKNYAAHIKEMGGDPLKTGPAVFMKTPQSITTERTVNVSKHNRSVHYEGELVLYLSKGGQDISIANAPECIFGISAGLDLTFRDLQTKLKKEGKPWEMSKAFDNSAPIGEISKDFDVGKLNNSNIETIINGEIRQSSALTLMLWKPAEIIYHISKTFKLLPGDVIFTGTPAGVGELKKDDKVRVIIKDFCEGEWSIE